ncbi:hypothetical protein ATO6_00080 [Oceanicola sp. 22II-s10i]|uniref:DUF805 domain-containing protein n=1 Tax=Oceanicola sp. 22II-s10i TaxID=1317116 RepID=UPI000B5212C0|nr:DUF805 domain-containing protein [Oceanicola sp. 22II-s10i]OWU85400.1 hypothetical protein ATO6_00080 [Oceanicola sp. 22II-s10i]
MSFTDSIRTCFRKYVTFSGRASRPEYWWFVLFLFIGQIVAGILDAMIFGTGEVVVTDTSVSASSDGPIGGLFSLATLLPALAAAWRRMHDTGRSGLYVLYPLIAMVGIASFIGMVGGFDLIVGGDISGLFTGIVGVILILALIVLALSPLIVLFWLTRPTQPETNQWGPPPRAQMTEGTV